MRQLRFLPKQENPLTALVTIPKSDRKSTIVISPKDCSDYANLVRSFTEMTQVSLVKLVKVIHRLQLFHLQLDYT